MGFVVLDILFFSLGLSFPTCKMRRLDQMFSLWSFFCFSRVPDVRIIPEGSLAALSEGPGEAGHTWLPGVSSGPPDAPPLQKQQQSRKWNTGATGEGKILRAPGYVRVPKLDGAGKIVLLGSGKCDQDSLPGKMFYFLCPTMESPTLWGGEFPITIKT